jgi:hypothetical protein
MDGCHMARDARRFKPRRLSNTMEAWGILCTLVVRIEMRRRRLEDRIEDLCRQATEREWPRTLAELRRAIREHTLRVANRTAAAIVAGKPQIIRERRVRRDVPNDWIPREFQASDDTPSVN